MKIFIQKHPASEGMLCDDCGLNANPSINIYLGKVIVHLCENCYWFMKTKMDKLNKNHHFIRR